MAHRLAAAAAKISDDAEPEIIINLPVIHAGARQCKMRDAINTARVALRRSRGNIANADRRAVAVLLRACRPQSQIMSALRKAKINCYDDITVQKKGTAASGRAGLNAARGLTCNRQQSVPADVVATSILTGGLPAFETLARWLIETYDRSPPKHAEDARLSKFLSAISMKFEEEATFRIGPVVGLLSDLVHHYKSTTGLLTCPLKATNLLACFPPHLQDQIDLDDLELQHPDHVANTDGAGGADIGKPDDYPISDLFEVLQETEVRLRKANPLSCPPDTSESIAHDLDIFNLWALQIADLIPNHPDYTWRRKPLPPPSIFAVARATPIHTTAATAAAPYHDDTQSASVASIKAKLARLSAKGKQRFEEKCAELAASEREVAELRRAAAESRERALHMQHMLQEAQNHSAQLHAALAARPAQPQFQDQLAGRIAALEAAASANARQYAQQGRQRQQHYEQPDAGGGTLEPRGPRKQGQPTDSDYRRRTVPQVTKTAAANTYKIRLPNGDRKCGFCGGNCANARACKHRIANDRAFLKTIFTTNPATGERVATCERWCGSEPSGKYYMQPVPAPQFDASGNLLRPRDVAPTNSPPQAPPQRPPQVLRAGPPSLGRQTHNRVRQPLTTSRPMGGGGASAGGPKSANISPSSIDRNMTSQLQDQGANKLYGHKAVTFADTLSHAGCTTTGGSGWTDSDGSSFSDGDGDGAVDGELDLRTSTAGPGLARHCSTLALRSPPATSRPRA